MVNETLLRVIAMDGPAASGKSTIGYILAKKLGFLLLDTGCMYRATTLAALQAGVAVDDETAVTQLAHTIAIDIRPPTDEGDGRQYTALLNGHDVTWDLRLPDVETHVSLVSSYVGVRKEMVRRQREFGQRGNVVMVGRDIGTVVMPDASLKLYITATAEERARRRWRDRNEQGHSNSFAAILADVERRDAFDSSRKHSPLRPADDAIIIDTSDMTPDEIIVEILGLVDGRLPRPA